MLFAGGFSFANFLMDVLTLFAFVIWFWLAISVFGDLFRREDISGWGKALWVIGVILFPYIGVLAYMISQGKGMAERTPQRSPVGLLRGSLSPVHRTRNFHVGRLKRALRARSFRKNYDLMTVPHFSKGDHYHFFRCDHCFAPPQRGAGSCANLMSPPRCCGGS